MSIRAIAWALSVKTGSPSAKLVLVKLADNANDEGRCWPSVSHIVDHTEMSERSVRQHIKALELAGLLTIEQRFVEGSQLPNVYILNLQQMVGGVHHMQGVGAACAPAPGAGDAPQVNRQEIKPSLNQVSSAPAELPDWVPKEAWHSFVEMRKKIRAPLTERAKVLALRELSKLRDEGNDPEIVLDQSTQRSWRGLFEIKFSNGAHNGSGKPNAYTTFAEGALDAAQQYDRRHPNRN